MSRRQYATPFHHAPYRECTDSSAGHENAFEVDADSEVTEVSANWRVASADRQAQFDAERASLERRYGHGFACAPGWLVWRSSDEVHVALRMRPVYSSDVDGPSADSVPWRIERKMRWGPLVDLYWCGAATEHLGS